MQIPSSDITQPLDTSSTAENKRSRQEDLNTFRQELGFEVEGDPVMMRVWKRMCLTRKGSTLLVTGKTGTGKDLVAQSIHRITTKGNAPFVRITLPVLSRDLIESELFGHERGSFTGAVFEKQGCFERAQHGTLFLDEIGAASTQVHLKLLEVLQNRTYKHVGGKNEKTSDATIVLATNRDLKQLVEQSQFPEDLFYRMNRGCIHLPEWDSRTNDHKVRVIFTLLCKIQKERGIRKIGFDKGVHELLISHNLRGNVRELYNIIEDAVLNAQMDESKKITKDHIEQAIHASDSQNGEQTQVQENGELERVAAQMINNTDDEHLLNTVTDRFQHQLVLTALQSANGNKLEAAKLLGIDRKRLHDILREE